MPKLSAKTLALHGASTAVSLIGGIATSVVVLKSILDVTWLQALVAVGAGEVAQYGLTTAAPGLDQEPPLLPLATNASVAAIALCALEPKTSPESAMIAASATTFLGYMTDLVIAKASSEAHKRER
jgi:hypothetical protein